LARGVHMQSSARVVSLAALLVLAAGNAAALGTPPLVVKSQRDRATLTLGPVQVTSAEGRIANPRWLTFENSSTVLMTWEQYAAAARTSMFALSLDGGATIAQVMATENKVRLRYATFDP